jgi:hypothetical protein
MAGRLEVGTYADDMFFCETAVPIRKAGLNSAAFSTVRGFRDQFGPDCVVGNQFGPSKIHQPVLSI